LEQASGLPAATLPWQQAEEREEQETSEREAVQQAAAENEAAQAGPQRLRRTAAPVSAKQPPGQ